MVRGDCGGLAVARGPDRAPTRRWREIGRRAVGVLAAVAITAYGASAAVSVALSDEETVAGKGRDAVAAVPNLKERYEAAKYVADHRQEIQSALETFRDVPPEPELRDAVDKSSETLRDIEATANAVDAARDAVGDLSPFNAFSKARAAGATSKRPWMHDPTWTRCATSHPSPSRSAPSSTTWRC